MGTRRKSVELPDFRPAPAANPIILYIKDQCTPFYGILKGSLDIPDDNPPDGILINEGEVSWGAKAALKLFAGKSTLALRKGNEKVAAVANLYYEDGETGYWLLEALSSDYRVYVGAKLAPLEQKIRLEDCSTLKFHWNLIFTLVYRIAPHFILDKRFCLNSFLEPATALSSASVGQVQPKFPLQDKRQALRLTANTLKRLDALTIDIEDHTPLTNNHSEDLIAVTCPERAKPIAKKRALKEPELRKEYLLRSRLSNKAFPVEAKVHGLREKLTVPRAEKCTLYEPKIRKTYPLRNRLSNNTVSVEAEVDGLFKKRSKPRGGKRDLQEPRFRKEYPLRNRLLHKALSFEAQIADLCESLNRCQLVDVLIFPGSSSSVTCAEPNGSNSKRQRLETESLVPESPAAGTSSSAGPLTQDYNSSKNQSGTSTARKRPGKGKRRRQAKGKKRVASKPCEITCSSNQSMAEVQPASSPRVCFFQKIARIAPRQRV